MTKRPTGVSVIAILQWTAAAILVAYCPIFVIRVVTAVSRNLVKRVWIAPAGAALTLLVGAGVLLFLLGLLLAATGRGLWRLQNWARIVTVVLAALSAAFRLSAILQSVAHPGTNSIQSVTSVVVLAFDAAVIVYLTLPRVKNAFVTLPNALAASSAKTL